MRFLITIKGEEEFCEVLNFLRDVEFYAESVSAPRRKGHWNDFIVTIENDAEAVHFKLVFGFSNL